MTDAPSGQPPKQRLHVLTLSEQSAHVRSVARSWAAGEVSLEDYRMIRSLTLEGMLSGELATDLPASDGADAASVDEPDDDHDITEVGDHRVDDEDDDTDPNAGVKPELTPAGPPGAPIPRLALIAGGVLLLLGLILLLTLL